MNTTDRGDFTPVDKSITESKRCGAKWCRDRAVHTWWLCDDNGQQVGPTYICRPGAPS